MWNVSGQIKSKLRFYVLSFAFGLSVFSSQARESFSPAGTSLVNLSVGGGDLLFSFRASRNLKTLLWLAGQHGSWANQVKSRLATLLKRCQPANFEGRTRVYDLAQYPALALMLEALRESEIALPVAQAAIGVLRGVIDQTGGLASTTLIDENPQEAILDYQSTHNEAFAAYTQVFNSAIRGDFAPPPLRISMSNGYVITAPDNKKGRRLKKMLESEKVQAEDQAFIDELSQLLKVVTQDTVRDVRDTLLLDPKKSPTVWSLLLLSKAIKKSPLGDKRRADLRQTLKALVKDALDRSHRVEGWKSLSAEERIVGSLRANPELKSTLFRLARIVQTREENPCAQIVVAALARKRTGGGTARGGGARMMRRWEYFPDQPSKKFPLKR